MISGSGIARQGENGKSVLLSGLARRKRKREEKEEK